LKGGSFPTDDTVTDGAVGYPCALALIEGCRLPLVAWSAMTTDKPPITDAHCLKRHSDVVESQTFQNHFHAVLNKWQAQSPSAASCVSCHESHVTDGAAEIGYLNETRTTVVWQACHTFVGRGS
jgi:cytochrome c553